MFTIIISTNQGGWQVHVYVGPTDSRVCDFCNQPPLSPPNFRFQKKIISYAFPFLESHTKTFVEIFSGQLL